MTGQAGILRPEDIESFESFVDDDRGDFEAMLECIGRTIADGMRESRFTEQQVHSDLELALWISYACINLDDYEHYCTACEWLSRVEESARGCGTWYYRYANALMYCGKPRMALEYLSRGVAEDPSYPWNWLTLGRLKAFYGDRKGAKQAVAKGLELVPDDPEFTALSADIENGASLESMEMHPLWEGKDVREALESGDTELASKAESVMGIVLNRRGLDAVRRVLRPEGWIADHPYCTFMGKVGDKQALFTLAMNEAYASKLPADGIRRIMDSLPSLEETARGMLPPESTGKSLYGVTIYRNLGVMLSFGGFEDDVSATVSFNRDLQPLRPQVSGGPFVAFVLLSSPSWDPAAIPNTLLMEWGVRFSEKPEGDSLVFEYDGDLGAYSIVKTPVPNGEAEENARNNYMWPEAFEVASRHQAHLLIALVNHGGSPMDAAMMHTKMVAAACRLPNATAVYFQGTVVSTEDYLAEAEKIREGDIPIANWIWFGLYGSEQGCGGYTRGLETFGRREVEAVGMEAGPEELRNILSELAYHLISNDESLVSGDVIELPDGRRLKVEESPGVALEGSTLKISFEK